MTVGYLKEQLENYPDDARIILDCGPLNYLLDERNRKETEIIDMFSTVQDPNILIMQRRCDFDYMNELYEKYNYLYKVKHAENWKEILINQGFTEDEIRRVENNVSE